MWATMPLRRPGTGKRYRQGFGLFRKIIWCAMAAGLTLCFTVLPGFFGLRVAGVQTLLVMGGAFIIAPLVFFLIQRLFDLGDRWIAIIKN